MKFRSDFVTNSSSANYMLTLILETEDTGAGATFAVSPEMAFTSDGGKVGKDIHYAGDVSEIATMVKDDAELDDIVNKLCSGLKIDRFEYDEDDYDDEEEDDDFGDEENSVSPEYKALMEEIEGKVTGDGAEYPRTIKEFKESLKRAAIKTKDIRYLIVDSGKFGNGDSAMWVELDFLDEYKERYKAAVTEEEKEKIIVEAADYILGEPEVEVEDNEYTCPDCMPLVWEGDPNVLCACIEEHFKGKKNHKNGSYWMGTWSQKTKYDFKTGEKKERDEFCVNSFN